MKAPKKAHNGHFRALWLVYKYQILVTVAGTVPDPRGETGTFITLLVASGEQKECLFFPRSGNSVVFWGGFGCSVVLVVVIVIDIVFFWCGCTCGCGFWLICIAFGVFRWVFDRFIVFLTLWLVFVGFVTFCLFLLLLLLLLVCCFSLLLLLLFLLFFVVFFFHFPRSPAYLVCHNLFPCHCPLPTCLSLLPGMGWCNSPSPWWTHTTVSRVMLSARNVRNTTIYMCVECPRERAPMFF